MGYHNKFYFYKRKKYLKMECLDVLLIYSLYIYIYFSPKLKG